MNTLDLLLNANLSELKTPTKEVKIKRLSEVLNTDVVFKVRAISYDRRQELIESNDKDFDLHIVLEGVQEPNLRSKELMEKYNAVTPIETIKKLLLPGEIHDLYTEVSKLSGFGVDTIEEIKKK